MRAPGPDVVTATFDSQGREIRTEAIPMEPHDVERMCERLGKMAIPHTERSNGGLVLIERDTSPLPFHTMGDPIPTDAIEKTATLADPRYTAIQEAVDKALGRAPNVIPSVYDTLEQGRNVGLCFSHRTIQDVPLGFGAFLSRFGAYERFRQKQGDEQMDVTRGMLVSQLLKMIGITINPKDPTPADHVMTMLAHDVWSTIPTAQTARGLRQDMRGLTRRNNDAVKESLNGRQELGGLFLAASLEGSTMKPKDGDPQTFEMNAVTDGTMGIAMHPNTRWLFLAILVEEDGIVSAEFSGASEGAMAGELRNLTSPDEVNAAMVGLGETATAITVVPGRQYIYEPKKPRRMMPHRKSH